MKIYAFLKHLGLTQWALLMWGKKKEEIITHLVRTTITLQQT